MFLSVEGQKIPLDFIDDRIVFAVGELMHCKGYKVLKCLPSPFPSPIFFGSAMESCKFFSEDRHFSILYMFFWQFSCSCNHFLFH